jgi:hypothetical protein
MKKLTSKSDTSFVINNYFKDFGLIDTIERELVYLERDGRFERKFSN